MFVHSHITLIALFNEINFCNLSKCVLLREIVYILFNTIVYMLQFERMRRLILVNRIMLFYISILS